AAAAVYAKRSNTTAARNAAWPGYYYYGVYYGSYRWRYQPYYSFYASPWYSGDTYPVAGYVPSPGFVYPAHYYTWPHYGAYGYTYYGPVTYGYGY
ncbi:MAG: hypothetical protein KY475_04880, partial [Planctomycetes bacterium]|nr:hypothetical protein [Planctomycetota bacterium]